MPDQQNRRGRRSPGLAAELAAAERIQATQQPPEPQHQESRYQEPDEGYDEQTYDSPNDIEPPVLYPGDYLKVSRSSEIQIDGTNHWFGAEASTAVQPHEGEEGAFARVYDVVFTRVEDMADAAQESVRENIARRRQEERRRRIQPTS